MSRIETQVRNFDRYVYGLLAGGCDYNPKDKDRCIRQHIAYMLNRTQTMFRWSGLPDSVPVRSLELFLQTNGNVCWYHYQDRLWVLTGGLGGEPDPYYMPTIYTVANPALKLSANLRIDEDCVVMPNDSLYLGLLPLYSRYAAGLTENELSMRMAMINLRIVDLMSATDDRTRESALEYLRKVEDGDLGVIADPKFLEGVKAQPYGNTANNTLTSLIECEQYLKAGWYNEIGLNANYNMKRESLNTSESQMNNDALLPLVDDMLACRRRAAEKVNAMFGTGITVDLDSSWEDNIQEIALEHDEITGEDPEAETEPAEDSEEVKDDESSDETPQ